MFLPVNGLFGWIQANDRRSVALFAGFVTWALWPRAAREAHTPTQTAWGLGLAPPARPAPVAAQPTPAPQETSREDPPTTPDPVTPPPVAVLAAPMGFWEAQGSGSGAPPSSARTAAPPARDPDATVTPVGAPSEYAARMQTTAFLPIRFSPSPRPTVVVVLPSPAGVGLIAVTRISLPLGRSESESMKVWPTLALSWP